MNKKCILILIFLCAVLLLQSCGQNDPAVTPQAGKLGIDSQNYPKIDGSTASLPIVQEIYKAMYNPETVDGKKIWSGLPQSASKTITSYNMLIDGGVDMIIVPDPSEEVKSLAEEKGVELEYTPVCLEALIFIVNKITPVNNITTEELRSIYIDRKITYWSRLAGGDINDLSMTEIFPYTRNEDSGSHALMEKFILKGDKINEQIAKDNMASSMFMIVDDVENNINFPVDSNYKYQSLPLGYTLYYFFQNNKEAYKWDNVKILSIDGTEANDETIASGKYPYSTCYYAVIRSDNPKDSPSRKLISWLLSKEGQKIFTNAGFGAVK